MVSHILQVDPLFWILLQELADQIAGKWRDEVWVLDVDVTNPPACGPLRIFFEWRSSDKELVQENAKLPDVHAGIVLAACDHFWWKVVEGPAESGTAGCWGMDRPSEVCKLEISVQANKDVLWFDIAVDDVLGVAVMDGVAHLNNVGCGGLLVEPFCITKHLEQLSTGCVFDNEVDASLVPEVAVKPDDVGMAQV